MIPTSARAHRHAKNDPATFRRYDRQLHLGESVAHSDQRVVIVPLSDVTSTIQQNCFLCSPQLSRAIFTRLSPSDRFLPDPSDRRTLLEEHFYIMVRGEDSS